MKQLTLKVSRASHLQFPMKKRVKHGKGRVLSKTNPLLLAKHSLISINTFIDKKAGICEIYETYQSVTSFKNANNIGMSFIDGTLQKSVKKRLTHPTELLYGTAMLEFEEVTTNLIQKIVKQWLFMHICNVPTNKEQYRSAVNKRNIERKERYLSKPCYKRKKAFVYKDELIFKGIFEVTLRKGIEIDTYAKKYDSLTILGIDSKGNYIISKGIISELTTYLNDKFTSIV